MVVKGYTSYLQDRGAFFGILETELNNIYALAPTDKAIQGMMGLKITQLKGKAENFRKTLIALAARLDNVRARLTSQQVNLGEKKLFEAIKDAITAFKKDFGIYLTGFETSVEHGNFADANTRPKMQKSLNRIKACLQDVEIDWVI